MADLAAACMIRPLHRTSPARVCPPSCAPARSQPHAQRQFPVPSEAYDPPSSLCSLCSVTTPLSTHLLAVGLGLHVLAGSVELVDAEVNDNVGGGVRLGAGAQLSVQSVAVKRNGNRCGGGLGGGSGPAFSPAFGPGFGGWLE